VVRYTSILKLLVASHPVANLSPVLDPLCACQGSWFTDVG
jgi:hypothetical protein